MKKICSTFFLLFFLTGILYTPLFSGVIVRADTAVTCADNGVCAQGFHCSKPAGEDFGTCTSDSSGNGGNGVGNGNGGSGVGNGNGNVGTGNGNGNNGIGSGNGNNGIGNGNGNNGVGNGANSNCGPNQLCNPLLPQYGSLCDVLNGIISLVTQIGAVIAVLLIIWTGFKFISAQGNTTKLNDAKKAFYTTLLGTAILLGASGIATIVVKTVLTVTNQNNPGICRI